MRKRVISVRRAVDKHKVSFYQTFHTPLAPFIHPFFGLDIVAFDNWLHTPDGTSTADYVKQQYGQSAVDMIKELL